MNRKKLKNVLSLFITVLFTQINYAQTVTIGEQVWMTKNLNVDKFRNGEPIPQAKTEDEWFAAGKNKQPAWCYYKNVTANGEKYGKLYNWYAVNDSRGLAPKGYHIPSYEEWAILVEYLGQDAGKKMKNTSGWIKHDKWNTNSSSFSGLPGGERYGNGSFYDIGDYGHWWSSTADDTNIAWFYILYSNDDYLGRNIIYKDRGFSVRCLRD